MTYKGWPLYYYGTDSLRGNTLGVSVPGPGIWPVAVKDLDSAEVVTSIEKLDAGMSLRVYPNPAAMSVNIESDEAIESITLLSVTGTVILRISAVRSENYILSTGDLSPGVYFLEIRSVNNKMGFSRLIRR